MKVEAVSTRWAEPWDHHLICVNFEAILRLCGVGSAVVRRRLTAHAIVASGWRQNVWCYNPWGVKTGASWTGDWYEKNTQEDDGTGTLYEVPNAAWRAFPNWSAAVRDQLERISPASGRYAKAHAALISESRPDSDYWRELGIAGYYTDTTNMTPEKFASVCDRVEAEVSSATDAEKKAANAIVVGTVSLLGLAVAVAVAMLLA